MTFAFFDLWFASFSSDTGENRRGRGEVWRGGADAPTATAISPDDAGFVSRVREGDASALEIIFRTYGPALLRFAEQRLRSPEAAEDVVQDVFFSVWRIRATWEIRTSLATYLFQAVRHRIVNRMRQREGEDPRLGAVELTPGLLGAPELAPDIAVELAELSATVARVVASLSPKTREVFQLSRDHGLAYREIAAVLGVSVKTVEMHVGRALSALRVALDR